MDDLSETWRPIPGYEGRYEASDLGRIRSFPTLRTKGGVRSVHIDREGYPSLKLFLQGKSREQRVHKLVAAAFLGARPEGQEVLHKDGDRRNPALVNLMYGTRGENNLDQVRHGTHPFAFRTHCPADHEYTPANTRVYRGRRFCRTCAMIRTWRLRGKNVDALLPAWLQRQADTFRERTEAA